MNPETEEKIYFYTEDLQVGYGGKQILNPVRIGIKKGEILTLVGPNGAGKSTILKSVAAQLPPLGGAVYLDGADLLGMKGTERARRMAVMFTEKVHAEWMTCRDVVAAGRYPYTGRFGVLSEEDWKAVDEAMEAVQVSELRERDFQTLSDGQRQRVMLARAVRSRNCCFSMSRLPIWISVISWNLCRSCRSWRAARRWQSFYPFMNLIWRSASLTGCCASARGRKVSLDARKRC